MGIVLTDKAKRINEAAIKGIRIPIDEIHFTKCELTQGYKMAICSEGVEIFVSEFPLYMKPGDKLIASLAPCKLVLFPNAHTSPIPFMAENNPAHPETDA